MKAMALHIDTAANSDLTVLITGESGTGKELVARAIHERSARAAGPFVSFNCGAITETLLESELFGYVRGAFTGANRDRKGLFEGANQGTLFLDEIGEMSISCQAKLLRVLQESAVRPVGGLIEVPVDVRVVTATNRNLGQEIGLGRFRKDLLYRIAVLSITTPSLRQRASDIPLLVDHFIRQAAQRTKCIEVHEIDTEAVKALVLYDWPGNVRQLRSVVERLLASAVGKKISIRAVKEVLSDVSRFESGSQMPPLYREEDSLDEFLARALLGLYEHFMALKGSHSEVARILRVHRNSLYQRIDRARRRLDDTGAIDGGTI